VKEKLQNIRMADEDDLVYRLQKLLNEISIKELQNVFGAWSNRLLAVSEQH
jgi:hypothetical protein